MNHKFIVIDTKLADYIFNLNNNFNKKELDNFRQKILSKDSLTKFAIDLGLPKFSSSWNNKNRLSPEKQPRLWAEMFEAIVGVIFIDRQRNFIQLSQWLIENFFRPYIEDEDYSGYESDFDYIYADAIETNSGNIYYL
ncbi:ribonuclease III domain-containing protein [Geminocystis sp. CENA526]|uniref:ribonuclease III domain-containing protein n=1 Tax=Geminocystis sp. CENA526 TaxID=1355871 RepID=UPI003D6E2F49